MTTKTSRNSVSQTLKADCGPFLIITINHSHAGFFSYVNFAINQLIYAEKHKLKPVVFFGRHSGDGPNAFFDEAVGENTWDYFFEPVSDASYPELLARVYDPDDPLESDDVRVLSHNELRLLHAGEPESVFAYPYGIYETRYEEVPDWYGIQRQKAQRVIGSRIRVKPQILAKVDGFAAQYFADDKTLGIHMRGSDKGSAHARPELMRIVKPSEYFPAIDAYISKHDSCRIFVATDQQQFLEQMVERYGDRIVSRRATRTTGHRNPFEKKTASGAQLGEEVLIDCLLLSRCSFLLKCTSAVGEFAMYFNPDLKCLDMNHSAAPMTPFNRLTVRLKQKAYGRYLGWKRKAYDRSASRSADSSNGAPRMYHFLQTNSGFGDRLLDLWCAAAVARLHDPDMRLLVQWPKGKQYQAFRAVYSTRMFSIANCEFIKSLPRGTKKIETRFSQTELNETCYLEMPNGDRQLILHHGMNQGTNCPDRLHQDLAHYKLDANLSHDRVVRAYLAVANTTVPSPSVAEGIPEDMAGRIGIHIRLSDKLVETETAYAMTRETWQTIEDRAMSYIDMCIANGDRLFVCSDDQAYKLQLVKHIRDKGGDVIVSQPAARHSHQAGYEAVVDFFALAKCAQIVQMTKYSTFSMAASMIHRVPLVNFSARESGAGNQIDLWKSALCGLKWGADEVSR